MTSTQRTFTWINLILAALVVVGILVQVYLITSWARGAGQDALDAHKHLGNVVHALEVLTFIAALVAFWKRWSEVAWSFALALVGTIQIGFATSHRWVGGFHGFFALVVFVLAAIVTHRAMRHLGLGRGTAPG